MAKKERIYLSAGILLDGEKMFFLPLENERLSLPCLTSKKRIGKATFRKYLKIHASFSGKLGKLFIKEDREYEDAIYRIRVYVLEGRKSEIMKSLYWDQAKPEEFGEILFPIVNKCYAYLPLLEKREREIELEPEDQELVDYFLQAVDYFDARIPGRERKAFRRLIASPASIHRINEAFALLCNDYALSPKEFDAYFERKEKERQALR